MARFVEPETDKKEDKTLTALLKYIYDFNGISDNIIEYSEKFFDENDENMRKNEIHHCSESISIFENFCQVARSYVSDHPNKDKCPHCNKSM